MSFVDGFSGAWPKARGFLRFGRLGAPAEFFEQRTRFSFDGIGDKAAEDRSEFEGVTTPAGGDDEAGTPGIGRNPKIFIAGVRIQADAGIYDWRIRKWGHRLGKKFAQRRFFSSRYPALG